MGWVEWGLGVLPTSVLHPSIVLGQHFCPGGHILPSPKVHTFAAEQRIGAWHGETGLLALLASQCRPQKRLGSSRPQGFRQNWEGAHISNQGLGGREMKPTSEADSPGGRHSRQRWFWPLSSRPAWIVVDTIGRCGGAPVGMIGAGWVQQCLPLCFQSHPEGAQPGA